MRLPAFFASSPKPVPLTAEQSAKVDARSAVRCLSDYDDCIATAAKKVGEGLNTEMAYLHRELSRLSNWRRANVMDICKVAHCESGGKYGEAEKLASRIHRSFHAAYPLADPKEALLQIVSDINHEVTRTSGYVAAVKAGVEIGRLPAVSECSLRDPMVVDGSACRVTFMAMTLRWDSSGKTSAAAGWY